MFQFLESDVNIGNANDLIPELRHENGGSLLIGENLLQHQTHKVPSYALRYYNQQIIVLRIPM